MHISVIVPFYHGNKYINNLISILDKNYQNLKNNNYEMQVVLVNDSPGEEISITCDYAVPVKFIKNEKNIGIHKSRLKGLENAEGEYVHFLDQDDTVSNNYYLSQLKNIKDADFVVANGYLMTDFDNKRVIFDSKIKQQKSVDLNYSICYSNMICSPGSVLIKRTAIPQEWKSITFKNNGADDHFLWLLMLLGGCTPAINEEKIYTHVFTGANESLKYDNMFRSNLELLENIKGKIDKKRFLILKRRIYRYKKQRKLSRLFYLDVDIIRKKYSKIWC